MLTTMLARPKLVPCYIEDKGSNFASYVTFIYGYNTNINRKDIWEQLGIIHKIMTDLWVILGDFSIGLSMGDRISGAPIQQLIYMTLTTM